MPPAIEVTAQLKLENRRLPSVAASFLGALLAGARALAYCTLGIADAIVSAHIRALMAPQPTDVASPDRHTVKSWFKGKLAFAPVVEDLGAEGFALVGARAICGARLLPRQAFDQPNGNAGYAWAFLIHWS
jgi:anti-sigma factor RsiW